MDAIEFVKEYGIDVAKRTLNNATGFGCAEVELFGGKYIFRTDDLKKIVEAFELVEGCGGIETVKKHLKNGNVFRFGETPLMKKAIELVEKCNENQD